MGSINGLNRVAISMKRILALILLALLAAWTVQAQFPQEAKLTADDAAAGDQFGAGSGVAIFGDTAVVGACKDDDAGENSGSAYVFTRVGTTWVQQAKLVADDAAAGDRFGYCVAIYKDTILVGSFLDDDAGSDSGSAYVFTRVGPTWVQQAKLVTDDAAAGARFGTCCSLFEDIVVVGGYRVDGTDSSAYVFTRSGTTWTQRQKLVGGDTLADDHFGISVSVFDNTIVVGACYDDDAGEDSGSAYVFVCNGTTWNQQAKLAAVDAAASDLFGIGVAISGDTVVVGACQDDDAGSDSGSAYVFTRSGTTWAQQAKLVAEDATAGDEFGGRISLSQNAVTIGAKYNDDAGDDSGSAYVFTRSGTTWIQQAKLVADDAAADDWFGNSVSICDDTVVVGAELNDDAGSSSGSAYVFKALPSVLHFGTDGTPGATVNGAQVVTYTVGFGQACTAVTAEAPAGHAFTGWTGDHIGFENPLTITNVTADLAITANFASVDETAYLTMAASGNGSVDPEGTFLVRQGAAIAITATPIAGSQFIRWTVFGDGVLADRYSASTTVTLTGDAVAVATFSPDADTAALTVVAGPNGSVNSVGTINVLKGQPQDIQATPDATYHFAGWAGTAGASFAEPAQSSTTVSLSQDATVTASFAINEYRVEFVTDGTEGATLTGDLVQTVAHGGVTTPVLAVAPDAHAFVAWSGGYTGTANPLTVTVTSAMTIVAHFQVDQVACGSTFQVDAANIEGLPIGDVFRFKPKVYATYTLNGKDGKATAKVLTKIDKVEWPDTISCEWTKKLRLYDAKAFKASEAGGVGAATWITAATMSDLVMDLRLASKEAPDQSVQPLALAVPVIEGIADGEQDEDGNQLLVITGTWFGTKKPKVWREYIVLGKDGGPVIKRQAMKVVKPTEADAALGFKDSKENPAHMNAETGESKVVVIVPAKDPKGMANGTIVLDNGVGMAVGGVAVGDLPVPE